MYQFRIFFILFCLLVAILMLLGFSNTKLIYMDAVVLLNTFAWILGRRKIPTLCLAVSAGIAAAGILLGVPALFMLTAAGSSLAAWDMVQTELSLAGNAGDGNNGGYPAVRFKALASALVTGFLVIFPMRFFHIRIPFFIMILLIAFFFYGFNRIMDHLQRRE